MLLLAIHCPLISFYHFGPPFVGKFRDRLPPLLAYKGGCRASAACFVIVASCYTLPIDFVLSLCYPFRGKVRWHCWSPWWSLDGTAGPLGGPWMARVRQVWKIAEEDLQGGIAGGAAFYSLGGTAGPLGGPWMALLVLLVIPGWHCWSSWWFLDGTAGPLDAPWMALLVKQNNLESLFDRMEKAIA
jgi:hypothetical protein